MIRSTKCTVGFANRGKLEELTRFINEYRDVVASFVDVLWELEKAPALLPAELTESISESTWLSARIMQAAGKQASGIVRGTRQKHKQRLYRAEKLEKEGKHKQARRLAAIAAKVAPCKPRIDNVQPELDQRFVSIDFDNETSFDIWVSLGSLGDKLKLELPIKKHTHFNKMLSRGMLKGGVRLSKKAITFMFDLGDVSPRETGRTIGIDIGQTSTLSCSNGQVIEADAHGHTYKSICGVLARKRKNSKGFWRVVRQRTNYINWCVNQLKLDGVRQVNREDIKNLRKGRRSSRSLTHWNYAELFDAVDARLEDAGVLLSKRNPTYTSQRCSVCGWVWKGNRKRKRFVCGSCGVAADADTNASCNLSLELVPLGTEHRLKRDNRKGFYWLEERQEPIVPVALKTNHEIIHDFM